MLDPLTQRRQAVLRCIVSYVENRSYPPSVREIADELDLSVSTVHKHLGWLVSEGYIRRAPGLSRAIEVVGKVL